MRQHRNRFVYHCRREAHLQVASHSHKYRHLGSQMLPDTTEAELWRLFQQLKYHDDMAWKWYYACSRPWIHVEPDPSEPELLTRNRLELRSTPGQEPQTNGRIPVNNSTDTPNTDAARISLK